MALSSLSPVMRTQSPAFSPDTQSACIAEAQKLLLNANTPSEVWQPIDYGSILAGRIHPSRSAADLSLLTQELVGDGAHTQAFKAPFVTIDRQGKIRTKDQWVQLFITDSQMDQEEVEKSLNNQQKAYAVKGGNGHIAPPPQKMTQKQFLQPYLGVDLWQANQEENIPAMSHHRKGRPLDRSAQIECLLQVALGLEETHTARIIHGDLKLENVMVRLDPKGRLAVKLIDFGESTEPALAARHYPLWRQFWTTATQNGMPLNYADDIFGFGCLIADLFFPKLALEYDRSYLKWSQKELEDFIDSAVENKEDLPLADLLKKIFVADQRWTLKALRDHVAYVVFSTLDNRQDSFDLKDYHAIQPALWNAWRSHFPEPERFNEAPEPCEDVLKKIKADFLPGCGLWQADLEFYQEEMQATFPTLEEIITQLQRISRNHPLSRKHP